LFRKNSALFLKTLSDPDFLVPSSCYFGFEGQHTEFTPAFVKNTEKKFQKH